MAGEPTPDCVRPEVLVELVKTIPVGELVNAPRMRVREFINERGYRDIDLRKAQTIGRIARRYMLSNNLPIQRTWSTYNTVLTDTVVEGAFNLFPEKILDLAWADFQAGRKD